MKNLLLMLPLVVLLVQCKSKKSSLQDEDEIEAADFIEFFPEIDLPFRVADTTLAKKDTDTSLRISYGIFTRFVPDSIVQKDFGKNAKPVIYAMGRVQEKGRETYLFAKAVQGNRRVAYLVCFNRDEAFLNAMPLVKTGTGNSTSAYGMLDQKFQITTYNERRGGEFTYKKNVYFFNSETREFPLIFTEPNEEIFQTIINPIDTLAATGRHAGDYVKDKRNFVSVRDGKNASEILFFIHFEKSNGECKGELKGTARFVSETTAQYYENGNPCAIEFTFTASRLRIKETGGCGTYRDITCFFEDSYPKKKTVQKNKKL